MPATIRPEFRACTDCTWLFTPVVIDRTTQMSSTTPAVCGSNSETSVPLPPCLANFHGEPSTFELAWAALVDARILPGALAGRPVGVFTGVMASDYATVTHRAETVSSHTVTGLSRGVIAHRPEIAAKLPAAEADFTDLVASLA